MSDATEATGLLELGGFRVGQPVRLARPEFPAGHRAGQVGRVDALCEFRGRPQAPRIGEPTPPAAPPVLSAWVMFPDGLRGYYHLPELDHATERELEAQARVEAVRATGPGPGRE